MTSSTSSSKGLILRSLAVFAALFAGYNLAVGLAKPEAGFFQNQYEKNVAVVEGYILDGRKARTVVAGSSLTARLEEDSLGAGFVNLALAGGASATGLDIALRREPLPERVLVEANVPRELDGEFVEARFAPLSLLLKRILPSARIRYRPVNLLVGALRGEGRAPEAAPDPGVFARLLADQERDHASPPDTAKLRGILESMRVRVDALSARGVRVAFFEMPVHPGLAASPKAAAIREGFRRAFPPDRYAWIEAPEGEWNTGDGIHLAPASAGRYAAFLKAEAASRGP